MEDIKSSRNWLLLSSLTILLFSAGWASFSDSIDIGNTGLKMTAMSIAPYLLIAFWLYSWQRFYVISKHVNKPQIDSMISGKVNSSLFVFLVFPPKSFGLIAACGIGKWGWPHPEIPKPTPGNYVFYKRTIFKRTFMFNYFGNDASGDGLYVHFGPAASNIQNGSVTPLCVGYWKCIFFELKFLIVRLFDTPSVGFHYCPHILSWISLAFISMWHIQ